MPPPPPAWPGDDKALLRAAEQALLPSTPPAFAQPLGVPGPSAPALEDLAEQPEDDGDGGEDKAERERQRLMRAESMPPGVDDVGGAASAPEGLPEYRRFGV